MANTRNNPLEDLAIHLPMICDRYELRDDVMPGAGRFRGGLGVVKKQRIPTDRFITHECDRHTDMPWGIFGGGAVPTKTFIRSADSSCRMKTMNSSLTGGLRNARLRDGGERLRKSNFSVLRLGNQR